MTVFLFHFLPPPLYTACFADQTSKKGIMYIVGLTGGIGSGKTAVSDRFQAKGITIVDADLCSRVVVEKGRPALQQIAAHFGADILTADGELDRAALRQRIFANPDEKQWLEKLLHPLIAEELMNQLAQSQSAYTMMVSPLLIESRQNLICDRVLVVDVPEEVQLQRTMKRDSNDAEQVKRIIQSQADRQTRLSYANDVIENNHGLEQLDGAVERLHQQYLALAAAKNNG